MSKFNVCERELAARYDGAVVDFIGELARMAQSVEEERAIFAVGACLAVGSITEVATL